MRYINSITDYANQTFDIVIVGYDTATVSLVYKPLQYGWFMDVVWGNFSAYSIRLVCGPNVLGQFKTQIPFGIAIGGVAGIDPYLQNSFANGDSAFYVLDETEI